VRLPARLAAISLIVAAISPSIASAKLPSAANSTFPRDGIYLVGFSALNAPEPDPAGEFAITARGADNLPVQGATITVNFNSCTSDIVLSGVQTYPGTSILCNGPLGVVSGQTNSLGIVRFRILGGATGGGSGAFTSCADIRGNGVFLTLVEVAALDQVGDLDGLKPNDLAAAIADVNSGSTAARLDYDFDGHVLPNDLAILIHRLNMGGSEQNTGAICP